MCCNIPLFLILDIIYQPVSSDFRYANGLTFSSVAISSMQLALLFFQQQYLIARCHFFSFIGNIHYVIGDIHVEIVDTFFSAAISDYELAISYLSSAISISQMAILFHHRQNRTAKWHVFSTHRHMYHKCIS